MEYATCVVYQELRAFHLLCYDYTNYMLYNQ